MHLFDHVKNSHHLIGVFIGNDLVGIIGIHVNDRNGIVKHIAVLEEHRNQGIAKKMINHVVSYFFCERRQCVGG